MDIDTSRYGGKYDLGDPCDPNRNTMDDSRHGRKFDLVPPTKEGEVGTTQEENKVDAQSANISNNK
eukprot:CAMPEP_0203643728 /NCGR_PEP_ID=MMETSP0088-20131115/9163_1 /ASSEMBLY_ACC=CAM_ASM_001087 /TAXON_ID=426623 /ORGANISM="Chaetoceros affinis, Strain CCMP159" /LENGTH=65 /DNA_ID=CAMNT_0050499999 /DNA_START=139 /DNA_END=336 /DNA_ORIENTATION=+